MNDDIKAILYNVLGGILASAVTAIFILCRHRLKSFHLQRLLGFRFRKGTDVRITYGQLTLPPLQDSSGKLITHPYIKKPRRGSPPPTNQSYSMENAISECEVRASTYLTTILALPGSIRPVLVSDNDADALLDCNFIALGGPGFNYKTADILASPANSFVEMKLSGFSLIGGEPLPLVCNQEIDHGIILRITPTQFRNRSWIACAGLGEWGTSGTAWFLANKWRELLSAVHPVAYRLGFVSIPDFLAVIRVTRFQDQSAQIAALYRRSGDSIRKVI
jgi:hypothetical protein